MPLKPSANSAPPCNMFKISPNLQQIYVPPQVEGDALTGLTLLLDLPPAQRREAEVLAMRLGAEVGFNTGQDVQMLEAVRSQESTGKVLVSHVSGPYNTVALPVSVQ